MLSNAHLLKSPGDKAAAAPHLLPQTFPPPRPSTLWLWLNLALERGLVRMAGSGRRSDPYRYFLAQKLEGWRDDPLYQFTEMMRANDQCVARLARGEKE